MSCNIVTFLIYYKSNYAIKEEVKMRDRIIRIKWSAPFLLNDAISDEISNSQGLYYITRVFGDKETSLYLGIATKNNTIRHRLYGHRGNWLPDYRGKIYVRIGHIEYSLCSVDEAIDIAESAILYEPEHEHLFPENLAKRKSYTCNEFYRIENSGDFFEINQSIRMKDQ